MINKLNEFNPFSSELKELLNKLDEFNVSLNKDDELDGLVRLGNLSSELIETLKLINSCTDCKKKHEINNDGLIDDLIDEINNNNNNNKTLSKLEKNKEEKEKTIYRLDEKLTKIDDKLNRKSLCDGCKNKKIDELTEKCGNKEMAKLLYDFKINIHVRGYAKWIPFNEFKKIEYLAKGGFGEVYKATWVNYVYNSQDKKYEERFAVLKRLYNSNDKILDVLKEVNVYVNYIINVNHSFITNC